jgi:ribonucleoside-diphosphate reductase alpha chain
VKNPHFETLLEKYGKNDQETWKSIMMEDGSCQHLDFLTQHEKDVYKTIREISPMWIVEAAAAAQPHICQSQSVNIYVPPTITRQEMTDIHIYAWSKGLKSLYYCRSSAATKVKIGDGTSAPLNAAPVRVKIEFNQEGCLSCEG